MNIVNFDSLPDTALVAIFRKLNLPDHFRVHLVCKNWNEVAKIDHIWKSHSLMKIFPNAFFVDEKSWGALFFEKNVRPCLKNKEMYFTLRKMIANVENNQGISFVTLPKGLTIKKMKALAEKQGLIIAVLEEILKHLGDNEIKECKTFAITNSVFKNTKFESHLKQKTLVASLDCQPPFALAVMALSFFSSDKNFFCNGTITRCFENVESLPLGFGAIRDKNPKLGHFKFDFKEVGMAGMLELGHAEE